MIPRRIAYVLKIFPKLSETFIANELVELHRRGIELRILSLLPPREELRHEFIAQAGLSTRVHYEPAEFSSIVAGFGPHILHAHFATESAAAARELAQTHRIPFTFTAHGYDIHRKPPADFTARATAARAVVTVSEANAAHITRCYGIPRSHLRVIPCGVDIERFRPPAAVAQASPPASSDGVPPSNRLPLILCVARQVRVKNLEMLLEGCSKLREHKIAFRCVLVGDGPCRQQLEQVRARLGLEDCVEMPGPLEQNQVIRWWQQATIGVLSSDNEGMPVCLMEAAACGVPVVATAVGGVPELVEDGVTGLLTPAGDARALAAALETLLNDSEQRTRMSHAARKRAEEKFSVTGQVSQLLALWSEIVDGGNS